MDDFLIYGGTFDLCLDNLAKVLHRCEEVKLILNWKKCHFMVQKGVVLEHVVSHRGIEVDKANREVTECLSPPTYVKGVRSFLGHTGFYCHFIKDFSKTVKPFTLLLAKNIPFVSNNECLERFIGLRGPHQRPHHPTAQLEPSLQDHV